MRPDPTPYPLDHLARRGAPGAPALTVSDVTITYAELDDAVGRNAAELLDQGLAQGDRVGKEVFYSPTPAGDTAVAKYREVREACLIANLDTDRNADIGESARLLRTMSGLYDQAARAATSL